MPSQRFATALASCTVSRGCLLPIAYLAFRAQEPAALCLHRGDCLFLSLRCFLHELSMTSDFHWALFLRIMGLAAYHAHVAQRPVFNITSIAVASTTFTNLASLCRAHLNCRCVRCLAWSVMLPGRQGIRQECRAVHPPGATSPWSYFSTCSSVALVVLAKILCRWPTS